MIIPNLINNVVHTGHMEGIAVGADVVVHEATNAYHDKDKIGKPKLSSRW